MGEIHGGVVVPGELSIATEAHQGVMLRLRNTTISNRLYIAYQRRVCFVVGMLTLISFNARGLSVRNFTAKVRALEVLVS